MIIGIILAGGTGSRMHLEKAKQFYKFDDKTPLIVYALKAFQKAPSITNILIVCKEGYEKELNEIIKKYEFDKVSWIVNGGETHQESLTNALVKINNNGYSKDDIVVIHNANRPMVNIDIIEDSIRVCRLKGNGISAIPCVDTMIYSTDKISSNKNIDRALLYRAQSPQAYFFYDIYDVYLRAKNDGLNNKYETELMTRYGRKLYMSLGSEKNIKITTMDDVVYLKAFEIEERRKNEKVLKEKIHNINLEMMNIIMKICDKHNLVCYLAYGTLLGAVRHKGFIPWDDDIDLMMEQDQYLQLEKILKEELPKEYFLQTFETDRYYGLNWMKIRKNGTTCVDKRWNNIQCHGGVGLDIFQISRVPDNLLIYKLWRLIYRIQHALLETFIIEGKYTEINKKNYKLLYKFALKFPYKFRFYIIKLLNPFVFGNGSIKTKRVIAGAMKEVYPREILKGKEKIEFENQLYNVPLKYKEFLKYRYGDYMELPPINKRYGHNYVCVDLEHEIFSPTKVK